jgi:hypothetical protein
MLSMQVINAISNASFGLCAGILIGSLAKLAIPLALIIF